MQVTNGITSAFISAYEYVHKGLYSTIKEIHSVFLNSNDTGTGHSIQLVSSVFSKPTCCFKLNSAH